MTTTGPDPTPVPFAATSADDRRGGIWGWLTTPTATTRGFLLTIVWVLVAFCGAGIYAAVWFADEQRQSDCENVNTIRANARLIAIADVDTDRTIWLAIDDLIDNGLPEPARSTIFDGLDNRYTKIDETYRRTNCVTGELEPFPAILT